MFMVHALFVTVFVILFQPIKFLCDWILSKGMTVGEVKKEILEEIKRKYSIDIPYERSVLLPELISFCKSEQKYEL